MYAVSASRRPLPATASAACFVPGGVMTPGGKPVIALPGLTPTFRPLILDGPVLVTVDPASTPKLADVPKPTVGSTAAQADPAPPKVRATPMMSSATANPRRRADPRAT